MIMVKGFKTKPGIQGESRCVIGHHLEVDPAGVVNLTPLGQGMNQAYRCALATKIGVGDQAKEAQPASLGYTQANGSRLTVNLERGEACVRANPL